MTSLKHALRAGLSNLRPPGNAAAGHLLIAGGGGPLGSAVLEHALGASHWSPVSALVTQPVEVALRGLVALEVDREPRGAVTMESTPDTAIVVFDRERSIHGREAAFLRPMPSQLTQLAHWLRAMGVRRLILVLPHAPALLPQALKAGLASLDEQGVAALGFEQLVIVRPTRASSANESAGSDKGWPHAALSRLARGILAQLHWMVPQRDQPLRAAKVAQFVIALARELPGASPGTRIAPPELLWDWAQPDGGTTVLHAWLRDGRWLPAAAAPQRW